MSITVDQVVSSWAEVSAAVDNDVATATHSGVADTKHVVVSAEASYSNRANSGLLTVSFGSDVKLRKYIHGAGAIDLRLINQNPNEDVSVSLAASGSVGVTGVVTLVGYSIGD